MLRQPILPLSLATTVLLAAGCGQPSASTDSGASTGGATEATGTTGTTGPTGTTEPTTPTEATEATSTTSDDSSTGDPPMVPTCMGEEIPPADLAVSEDGLSVVVPCGEQSLAVTVMDPAIFRLAFDLPASPRPSHAVLAQPAPQEKPVIGGTSGSTIVCTEQIRLEVAAKDCHVRATDAAGTVILESPAGGGGATSAGAARTVRWAAAAAERFYGFGEKTGALDKRGRELVFYNTDAYDNMAGGYTPDADPLYASVPFFIGLRGGTAYGYFLDNTHRLTMDVAASDPNELRFTAAAGTLDQYLFAGPTIASVVERYTRLTGRTPLPPRWSLGFHQSRWGYSPQAKVLAVAEELRARGIPADAMWLDIQHMDGFRSFTWDPVTYPDPKGLTKGLNNAPNFTGSIGRVRSLTPMNPLVGSFMAS